MAGGGEAAQEKRHARGLLTARERLDRLFQRGTFQESGMHAHHDCRDLGDKTLHADGVVTGTGYVDNELVAAFAQDATVAAGTLGHTHAMKIVELMGTATRLGIRTFDVGTPLLSMHSARELCGVRDPDWLAQGMHAFYAS